MNSPAPMASANDSATCTTTSALRNRPDDPVTPRPACLSASFTSTCPACHAGLLPKSMLATTETPAAKSNTVQFTWMSARRGNPTCWAVACVSTRVPANASSSPSAQPADAMTPLSTSSWRTSAVRLAPSAARTAISRCRPMARASSKLATLAHAINRTSETAPIRKYSVARTEPTSCSCSGTARNVLSLLASG